MGENCGNYFGGIYKSCCLMSLTHVISRLSTTFLSIGGHSCQMLSSMLIFYAVIQNFTQDEFGSWVLFLAIISIIDSLRQGLIQNPLVRLIKINVNSSAEILSTALCLQFVFLLVASITLFLAGNIVLNFFEFPEFGNLLRLGAFPLLCLGILQLLGSLALAYEKLYLYFLINFGYCCSICISLVILIYGPGLSFKGILLAYACIGLGLYLLAFLLPLCQIGKPKKRWLTEIIHQGKYNSVTNLCSLLFQKADIFMIGYFLNPAAVGIFQLATKIIQYVELPLQAFGQTIYPRLAATQRKDKFSHLNFEYARGLFFLFTLTIPGVVLVFLFGKQLVWFLGGSSYDQAYLLLLILTPASLVKPWGRVFGLTLESVGLSQINLWMLLFSLGLNLVLNLILITQLGLLGAALATAFSTIVTIVIGQLILRKYVALASSWTLYHMIKKEILQPLK